MTYNELVTAVQDYTENTFLTADIDTMIKIAEQTIYNTVQLANLRKNVTSTLTVGSPYFNVPTDLLSVYSLAVISPTTGEYLYLLNKDVNFIREAYPNPGTATVTARGIPRHYALFGPQVADPEALVFFVGPTPNLAYAYELNFYYYPHFDSALFNGTMMEAIRFMKGEQDLVALYKDQFMQSMTLLKNLGDGKQRMDAYRDGQVRNPVQ